MMNRLRLLALVAAALIAILATWALARADSPETLGSDDATAGATMQAKDCVTCPVLNLRYFKVED